MNIREGRVVVVGWGGGGGGGGGVGGGGWRGGREWCMECMSITARA